MTKPGAERRWPKRFAWIFSILVFAVAVFAVSEHLRGKSMLERRIARLKSSGEKLDVAVFLPEPVAPERNAFTILATLTNRPESILTNLSSGPSLMPFIEPGKTVVIWKQPQWTTDEGTTNDWTSLTPQLNEARELIAELHAAASRPDYDCGFDYDKGFLDFQIGPLLTTKKAVQVLSIATANELHRGNISSAHSNLCALVKLVVMQEPEPLVLCQLVRFACARIAFEATWQTLQSTNLTESQLADLQTIWSRARFAEDMGRAMEMERAMALIYGDRLRNSAKNLEFALKEREDTIDEVGEALGSLPVRGVVLHRFYAPFWRFAWSAQDQLRSLDRWQFIIERERFARSHSWADLENKEDSDWGLYASLFGFNDEEKTSIYDRFRYLFSNQTFSITDVIIRKELEAQTLQQLVVTAVAIERHRKTSGTLPSDLDTLVPQYLPAISTDHMDGKPLRYRKESENSSRLYSVGTDGTDDGGDTSPFKSDKPFGQIWDGKDALWPLADRN